MIISVLNNKGGVAKTTSAINIGHYLSKQGFKVLLIDLDSQTNLTQSLGIDNESNIYNYLMGIEKISKIPKYSENLFCIPSNVDLAAFESQVSDKMSREFILKKLLKSQKGYFDFIFIDCPPSLGILTINALAASDKILIPLQAQILPLQGMNKLLEIISLINEDINPNLKILGIFFTFYDSRKNLDSQVSKFVQANFSEVKLFASNIPNNVSLAEAPLNLKTIFDYKPDSKGAKMYAELSAEILKSIEDEKG